MLPKLMIFDLDGTLSVNPQFYRQVYSTTLAEIIQTERGQKGLEMLHYYREERGGKGELTLLALDIPFRKWAELLVGADLSLISSNTNLVEAIRSCKIKKVIYSGSPRDMVRRILGKIGFAKNDFDAIFAWEEPEIIPVKWTCSPIPFKLIMQRFKTSSVETWSIGDVWETDLSPADFVGIKTVKIGEADGYSNMHFDSVEEFLKSIKEA